MRPNLNATMYYLSIPASASLDAIGLVAAHASGLLCVHIFRALYPSTPPAIVLNSLRPTDVAFKCRAFDADLLAGDWSIICKCDLDQDHFRSMWSVPAFGFVSAADFTKAMRVEYEPDLQTFRQIPCSVREALRLDRDSILDPSSLVGCIKAQLIDQRYSDISEIYNISHNRLITRQEKQ